MNRQNRNTTFWMSKEENVGPGQYDSIKPKYKETFNTGYLIIF